MFFRVPPELGPRWLRPSAHPEEGVNDFAQVLLRDGSRNGRTREVWRDAFQPTRLALRARTAVLDERLLDGADDMLATCHSQHVCLVVLGAVGATDDWLKLTVGRRSGSRQGLSSLEKLLFQVGLGVLLAYFTFNYAGGDSPHYLYFPFFKSLRVALNLGTFIAIATLVMTGSSNAVNLTDGLDGLAIGPVIMAAMVFALLAYLVGNVRYTSYLFLWHVPRAGELAVLLSALAGAGLGFLWFNAPPAMVFMGDTGALSIGGALGATAVVIKHEFVLGIVGGLFVLETVSVIVQVLSYKWTGKRIFRMAPLHHHFEQKGWAEPTIVFRFWIIAAILSMVGLATLKLR